MTAEEACDIIADKHYLKVVIGVSETDKGYIICEGGDNGEILYTSPYFVDKTTRKITTWFPPDHFGEKTVELEIPEKYAYKG